ncbi:hypothetical protein SAMN05216327_10111 [Dyadobacter sp. SG02]|uniref:permease prefix domain 2-containing transporter n=1 Tax=Dyadobacter sp. SG02 TaxID=1855291 RepID=UPI0008CFB6A1|nr:permease prefix domain 2-containing transporter [Dyadobacter sp. SG02]SEI37634.1 hypothetical protein SAMN05216327_10111 [Dyadobacter sp. SG02]
MATPNPAAPPRFFLALFRWFCDPDIAEDVEGDLMEDFHRNLEKSGRRKARRMFIREVMQLVRPSLVKNPFRSIHFNIHYMKKSDWVWIGVIHMLLIIMIVSPFVPGPSNRLVIGLSALGQSAMFLGLLLAPMGALWLFLDFRGRSASTGKHRQVLASIAAGVVMIPALLSVVYAFLLVGIAAGTAASALLGLCGFYVWKNVRRLGEQSRPFGFVPVCLLTVPGLSLFAHMCVIGPVSSYSRGLAMDRSEELIGLVEQFKTEKGRYPLTLQELENGLSVKLPDSPVMGISELKYDADEQGFNVSFSQWQHMAVDEEIVIFSKANFTVQNALGFDYKLDKHRVKGAYASFDADRAHWRYYWCD